MPKAEHKKVNRPTQDGYEIALDAQNDNVNKVWIRFGKSVGNNKYKWDHTVAMEQIALKQGQNKTLLKVNDDQLPVTADACYYQLLCEIEGEHGHPEILMTEPTLLM
jgi:hypothetical protein